MKHMNTSADILPFFAGTKFPVYEDFETRPGEFADKKNKPDRWGYDMDIIGIRFMQYKYMDFIYLLNLVNIWMDIHS